MPLDLGGLFKKGGAKLIEVVGDALDKNITNKEEREAAKLAVEQEANRHLEAMSGQALEIEKAFLGDVQNARYANVAIQESDKASWLAKNIAYMIDMFMAFIWGALTLYIAAIWARIIGSAQIDFTGILSLYSTVTVVFMITVNFHRGTSRGSEDKQKIMDRILKRG